MPEGLRRGSLTAVEEAYARRLDDLRDKYAEAERALSITRGEVDRLRRKIRDLENALAEEAGE